MGKGLERESTMKRARHPDPAAPEKLLHRLLGRLKRHALYDSVFFLLPPLLVLFLLANSLYRAAFLGYEMAAAAGAAAVGVAVLAGALRRRPRPLSLSFAARLVDARVQAQERFVTLATIDRRSAASSLLDRLRGEASGLLRRIDLSRDFPYRLKRSFAASAIASLIAFILFHVFFDLWLFLSPEARTRSELRMLARELAQAPGLSDLARSLRTLADEIKKRGAETPGERAKVEELVRRVEDRLKAGGQQGGGDALANRITMALQQAGSGSGEAQGEGGKERRDPRGQGGEGIERRDPKGQGGEGEERRSSGSGSGAGEVESVGLGEGEKGEGPQPRRQGLGERDRGLVGSKRPGTEPQKGQEIQGKAQVEAGRQAGKNRHEEIPRGEPPERFHKAGEGDKSVRGARFVTVQLPEEAAGAAGGEAGAGARRALRPKVPVSNVPLRRPDSPEPSLEKQPLPLEYRELIR
ncbi:MAG: hypothetical protein HYV04_21960 [Deltaproteobacteria bacterium]|nr:hypothetical protein [Deltaproteobacteria bacterium]